MSADFAPLPHQEYVLDADVWGSLKNPVNATRVRQLSHLDTDVEKPPV